MRGILKPLQPGSQAAGGNLAERALDWVWDGVGARGRRVWEQMGSLEAVHEGMKLVNWTSRTLTPLLPPGVLLRPRPPHLEVGAHQDEQTVWGFGPRPGA